MYISIKFMACAFEPFFSTISLFILSLLIVFDSFKTRICSIGQLFILKLFLVLFVLLFVQYVYLKQMTKAAVVIQNQFRSYYEHKRFKKNLESPSTSSGLTGSYRSYRDASIPSAAAGSGRQSREGTPTSSALK